MPNSKIYLIEYFNLNFNRICMCSCSRESWLPISFSLRCYVLYNIRTFTQFHW